MLPTTTTSSLSSPVITALEPDPRRPGAVRVSAQDVSWTIAAEAGIIDKSGAWYSYGKERIGQGRENAKLYLKDHPDMSAEVEVRVKEHLGVKPAPGPAGTEEEAAPSEE